MSTRRSFLCAAASTLLAAKALPAAAPPTEVLNATLDRKVVSPPTIAGTAVYESWVVRRKLVVTVTGAPTLYKQNLKVTLVRRGTSRSLGNLMVGPDGVGELRLETRLGQTLPPLRRLDTIRVLRDGGTILLAGRLE